MPISNAVVQRLLATATERSRSARFALLHSLARRFYRQAFSPAFALYLRQRVGTAGLTVKNRHSLVHGRGFNVFSSDVDFSIVLAPSFDQAHDLTLLLKSYERARALLPFIGELEVYEDVEWALKQRDEDRHGEILTMVRSLRKLSWEEKKLGTAPSEYHRQKCLNALARLLSEFGSPVEPGPAGNHAKIAAPLARWLESRFPATRALVTGKTAFSWHSGFLEATISSGAGPGLALGAHAGLVLSALSADADERFPDRALLERAREDDALRAAHAAVLRAELLLNHSTVRTTGVLTTATRAWLDKLRHDLGRYDPECALARAPVRFAFLASD